MILWNIFVILHQLKNENQYIATQSLDLRLIAAFEQRHFNKQFSEIFSQISEYASCWKKSTFTAIIKETTQRHLAAAHPWYIFTVTKNILNQM